MTECKVEVESLKKEILKLKADKDFVWSLWKRLQLSSPDLTEAVSLISQREKEKNFSKYEQLERDLMEKDKKLNDLQKIVDKKDEEIEGLMKSNNDILKKATQLEKHCADVTEKASKLDKLMKNIEENGQREIIQSYERERQQLSESVSKLQAQVTCLTDDKAALQIANVKNMEKIKTSEELQRYVIELRQQLNDANIHMDTQQDTIRMLRGQLESRLRYSNDRFSIDGYSSDRTDDRANHDDKLLSGDDNANEEERPISPIQDLNYKVDRLSLHMEHLQQCITNKTMNQLQKPPRSKSTPNRKNYKINLQQSEMSRKIEFLTNKLNKTETALNEERKNSTSATEFLEKSNKRVKSMQLTIKQLRKQIEDSKDIEKDSRQLIEQFGTDVEMCKKEIRNKELEIQRMNQNSMNDAGRIQNLLTKLEETRDELTEKKIKQEEEFNKEIERLKDLVKQMETEKCMVEMKCSSDVAVIRQQNCCHSEKFPHKHRSSGSRNKKGKTSSSKDRFTKSPKIKKMSKILNHFGNIDKAQKESKDDEWEDVDSDEEEFTTDMTNSELPSTDRSSNISTGTRIARTATVNKCCDKGDTSKSRNKDSQIEHIMRIQESREKSSIQEKEIIIAKNRAASLGQQLKTITNSRDSYRGKCKTMQTEMRNLHSDFQQTKLRCNRLIEAIKKQSSLYQVMMEERKQYLGITDLGIPRENIVKEFTVDIDENGSVFQIPVGEVSSIHKELQQELMQRNSELMQMRDKLSKLERDNNCKKRVIDDLRNKLVTLESVKEKEKLYSESREKKIKELEESNSRMKIQIESLQTRFNVVLDERRRFEQDSGNLMIKLETAERKLIELKQTKQIIESRLSNVDEGHEIRINEIVSRSGTALDKASSQIEALKTRGNKYESLVLNLAKDFHQKIREIRRLIEFGHRRCSSVDKHKNEVPSTSEEFPSGYDFARRKAADILNLSTAEIDSLLNGMTSTITTQHGKTQSNNSAAHEGSVEFVNRCRHAMKNKSFDRDIRILFVDKLEELLDLIAPPSCDSGCVSSC